MYTAYKILGYYTLQRERERERERESVSQSWVLFVFTGQLPVPEGRDINEKHGNLLNIKNIQRHHINKSDGSR